MDRRNRLQMCLTWALRLGIITIDLYDYLQPTHAWIPALYILPKTRKDLVSSLDRPIVLGRDSIFVHKAISLDEGNYMNYRRIDLFIQ